MKLKSILLTAVATIGFTAATVAQTPFCASDSFTSITSLPINSNDVAVIGNKLYTINAWSTTSNTLTEYDVNTGISSLISNPPFSLGETSITSYNNNLYFFGGYTGNTSNLAKMYNISTNTWTNLTNMPVSMTQTSAVSLNNYIYITGGSLGVTNQYFLKYDPNLNTYTTLAAPNPMFSNSKLVVFNNNIYCLGGHNANGTISNNLFVYDSNLNQWSTLSAIPSARTKLAATVWGDYLYVFGGAINPLFTAQFNYYAYDFINNSWTVSTNSIPSAIMGGAATINDTIYIANGSSSYKYFCAENLSVLSPPNNVNTIKVYPNPASTHITIDYGDYTIMNGYTLQIVNTLGQAMYTTPINQQSSYIDLTTWTGNGLYFVQIIDPQNNVIENSKIIIQ